MTCDAEMLRTRLRGLGFDVVRFAAAGPAPGAEALDSWWAAGRAADMAWMGRTLDKRKDPALVLPGTRSLIMLGVNYGPGAAPPLDPAPRWARYAGHVDYHDTLKAGLAAAGKVLEEMAGAGAGDYRYYVDTGPVLERGWAAVAGAGFIGKNAMLISRDFGNWLFLAAMLTRVELPPDPPVKRRPSPGGGGNGVGLLCGKCTRCMDACPTSALPAPGVLDARRCVSYQTIENRGIIPRELRPGIGALIYGCDTCLEVCPWNRFARAARSVLLSVRPEMARLTLGELLDLTPEKFAVVFRGTAVKRLKLAGLLRNACIVAANTEATDQLDRLVGLAITHPLAVVRAHAVWAVRRLGGGERLTGAAANETDELVRVEYRGEP
jgi:epoxyqueuosine reductase